MMKWLTKTKLGRAVFIALGMTPFVGMWLAMVSCFGKTACGW